MSQSAYPKKSIALPKFYRNAAIFFILATALLAGGFLYNIFGSVKIIVSPVYQKVSVDTMVEIIDMGEADTLKNAISGRLYEFEIEEDIAIPATGNKIVLGDTVGEVTLFNNYSQDQTLVATTRLLAPNGTLLRLKNAAVVKKGQKTQASVYPDRPEAFSELAPTRFTIPGLWKDLQDIIYAESFVTFRKGGAKIPFIAENDIHVLEKKILDSIDQKAQLELKTKIEEDETLYSRLLQKEILEKSVTGKVGEEKDILKAHVRSKVTAIIFDERKMVALMKKNLSDSLPKGKELKEIDPKNIIYTIERYDSVKKSVFVKVYAEGRAQIQADNAIFNAALLYGMREGEVKKYFQKYKEIESVEIEFSPSWLKRIPKREDKIEIHVL